MIRQHLAHKRQQILPWIEDWGDPQDHIRFEEDVNKLDYAQWFWCHPTAYKLIQYGIYILGFITYTVAGIVLYNYNHKIIALFTAVLAIIMLFLFKKKVDHNKNVPHFTFYDMYLRDYTVDANHNIIEQKGNIEIVEGQYKEREEE